MQTWTFDERIEWGEGPWDGEPDKGVWVDERTGLDCMIHRNRVGSLCGYVGVAQGHPWYGVEYSQIDADVHGGLTFTNVCGPTDDDGSGICHTPLPGRPHDVWWVGFDTAHANDYCPDMRAKERILGQRLLDEGDLEKAALFLKEPGVDSIFMRQTYKTWDYVRKEVERLALQAAAAA